MSSSLKARFNGNAVEVIEYTKLWGRFKAMQKYEVCDYVAFSKWLEEETGDPNFGLVPEIRNESHHDLAEELLDAFTSKLSALQVDNVRLGKELTEARNQIEYYKGQNAIALEGKIKTVMAMCRS